MFAEPLEKPLGPGKLEQPERVVLEEGQLPRILGQREILHRRRQAIRDFSRGQATDEIRDVLRRRVQPGVGGEIREIACIAATALSPPRVADHPGSGVQQVGGQRTGSRGNLGGLASAYRDNEFFLPDEVFAVNPQPLDLAKPCRQHLQEVDVLVDPAHPGQPGERCDDKKEKCFAPGHTPP